MNNKLSISVFLLGIAMLCPLIAADESETLVNIANALPSVGTVTVDPSPIVPLEGTTVPVSCWAIVTDTNGWEDIETADGVLYLNSSGSGCGADPADCYIDASCTLSGGSGNTVNASCDFTVQFYAQATSDETNWTCYIHVIDNGTDEDDSVTNVTMSDTLALSVTSLIDFGNMIIGGVSSDDETAIVTNTGNVRIDVNLNGTQMACDVLGNIAVGQIHYNATAVQTWANMCPLTGNPANTCASLTTNFDLAEGAAATQNTYWKLTVPSGVSGGCEGNVTFEAEKG
jgi:hypothetical protein